MPPVITPLLVSRACNISKKSAKGLLKRAGVLERQTSGEGASHPWIAQPSRVREKLEDVYLQVYAYIVARGPDRA